ncbi:hypothetical protein Tco_0255283 [Tanacetum coccineum]
MHIEKNVLKSILNTLLLNDKSKDTAKARQDLKKLGIRSGLWLGQTKNGKCSKPQAAYSFSPENRKKFCLLPYGLQQYLPDEVAKPIIELCSFFKQICSATLMEDDMLKAQSKVVDILCNLELIYPPAFFDIMIHLVIHLPLEALEGGPIRPGWMFPFERFMKKLKGYVRNKAKPEVNGVRFVVHSRDERRTTPNNGICSPDGNDGEMYYGQLQEILEFSYLSFKLSVVPELNGQSREVDAPPDIIDLDEDNDIIDDKDALPHDLADLMDEDLVNVEDEDGCRRLFILVEEEIDLELKSGPIHTHQENPEELGIRDHDDKGPVPIGLSGIDKLKDHDRPLGGQLNGLTTWGAYQGDAFVLPILAEGPGGAEGGDRDQN